MTANVLATVAALASFGGAALLTAPTAGDYGTFAQWAARPAVLPFAWRGVRAAERHGDPVEAFARARALMRLLPQWADGFAAFAYRYVLAPDTAAGETAAARAERVRSRLLLALAWLDGARAGLGRHEPSLLQAMAFLPEVAARAEPGLAEALRPQGGPAALADRWLAEAEARFPSAAAHEQRTFYAVPLAAGLLAAGDRAGALAVVQTAIERSRQVRDQEVAGPWRERLAVVERALRGEPDVDLRAVLADPRFAALHPHLR
jgi:hypothetical protein